MIGNREKMTPTKTFLTYFLIILANGWCLHRAHADCTTLYISYADVPQDPNESPNWTASVWYTPCGETKEALFAFHAREWKDNKLSIESGTRVRIGPQGMPPNMDSIDQIMQGKRVDILCSGTIGTSRSDKNYAKCKVVNQVEPLQKCTKLTIDYMPDAHWTASVWYTPCGRSEEDKYIAHEWNNNSVMIQSGTRVRIGPMATFTNYIDQILPDPATGLTHVICHGAIGNPTGGCCIGKDIRDCINKKATKPK